MNSKRPTRDTIEGSAYLDVQNAARRAGRDTAEYMALYALECFLARLAASPHASDFVLKGGVLLAAFAARRPTRDIDFQAAGFPSDVDEVISRARDIAGTEREDGIAFDLDSIRGTTIRDEHDYTGVRAALTCSLFSAKITFHLDVSFGDPIWPEPTISSLPLLLGGNLPIRAYPIHMVLAEKITTAIGRGTANTRWRDFVDIAAIAHMNTINGVELEIALQVAAEHRDVSLAPLATVLDGMAVTAQSKWAAWRRKQSLQESTPAAFDDLVNTCATFADPAITRTVTTHTWDGSGWIPRR